ncbi:MAG: hydrogen gas-evolving membrane-bound hydrogenase subunit E, partial [Candidatus Sericytochromatia bacterium]
AGKRDWGRWAIAAGSGLMVASGVMWVTRDEAPATLGAWYADHAYARTGMADLVTAILTDFRALDTAIEILVFATTALAVIGLFRRREEHHE